MQQNLSPQFLKYSPKSLVCNELFKPVEYIPSSALPSVKKQMIPFLTLIVHA